MFQKSYSWMHNYFQNSSSYTNIDMEDKDYKLQRQQKDNFKLRKGNLKLLNSTNSQLMERSSVPFDLEGLYLGSLKSIKLLRSLFNESPLMSRCYIENSI